MSEKISIMRSDEQKEKEEMKGMGEKEGEKEMEGEKEAEEEQLEEKEEVENALQASIGRGGRRTKKLIQQYKTNGLEEAVAMKEGRGKRR